MRRLPILVLVAALTCAAAYGAVRPQPAAALSLADQQAKQNVLLLRGYLDRQASGSGFLYPTKAQVRKGGGLSAPVWPLNPWTGKAMAPGAGRGSFTYTPAADRHSYTLVAHLSKGSYKLTGASPGWLATERAKAAADLTAVQADLTGARADLSAARSQLAAAHDSEAELGARVIKGYIESWGLLHNASAPQTADVSPAGVGAGYFWPKNPWTGADMAVGSGVDAGDLNFADLPDGISYVLSVHTSAGRVDLDGAVTQTLKNSRDALRDELMKANMYYLQASVDRYAMDFNDTFPPTGSLNAPLGNYAFDYWPMNPWTGVDMAYSTNLGDYTYTQGAGTYQIAGHLSDGTDYTVDDYWSTRVAGMRERFKDLQAQADVQVLKDYVDEWAQAHSGALPAAADLAASGAVGAPHTWWPRSPWTNAAMVAGSYHGEFQYVDNGDGTYTLTVREVPFLDPKYGGQFPEYYTAQ
jgi:hypothetical protein